MIFFEALIVAAFSMALIAAVCWGLYGLALGIRNIRLSLVKRENKDTYYGYIYDGVCKLIEDGSVDEKCKEYRDEYIVCDTKYNTKYILYKYDFDCRAYLEIKIPDRLFSDSIRDMPKMLTADLFKKARAKYLAKRKMEDDLREQLYKRTQHKLLSTLAKQLCHR